MRALFAWSTNLSKITYRIVTVLPNQLKPTTPFFFRTSDMQLMLWPTDYQTVFLSRKKTKLISLNVRPRHCTDSELHSKQWKSARITEQNEVKTTELFVEVFCLWISLGVNGIIALAIADQRSPFVWFLLSRTTRRALVRVSGAQTLVRCKDHDLHRIDPRKAKRTNAEFFILARIFKA